MRYKMISKNTIGLCLLTLCISLGKAQFKLAGAVKSEKGESIPFAFIGIKNTQLATVSKEDGSFEFDNLKSGTYVLSFKCLGYLEKAIFRQM